MKRWVLTLVVVLLMFPAVVAEALQLPDVGVCLGVKGELYGTSQEKQSFRETVCRFIRFHMFPGHILDQIDPDKRLLRAAADGSLCRDFTIEHLCLLAEADARGRVASDTDELIEKIALCRQEAQRVGCLLGPGRFADDYTQRAYFKDRNVWREQAIFNDTWGK